MNGRARYLFRKAGRVAIMQEKLDDSGKNTKTRDKVKSDQPPTNPYTVGDAGEFARNMVRVGQQSQRLLADFFKRQSSTDKEPLDPLNLAGPFLALVKAMAANPTAIIDAQFQLWRDFMSLWEVTARKMLGGHVDPVVTPKLGDKR